MSILPRLVIELLEALIIGPDYSRWPISNLGLFPDLVGISSQDADSTLRHCPRDHKSVRNRTRFDDGSTYRS